MSAETASTTDLSAYCRAIEAHLCRRNGGHLVRVVGPAFELAKEWAATGVPVSVVLEGIDRTVDRVTRKSTARRRPVPLDFCAADVSDAFDRWRRAVGVGVAPSGSGGGAARGRGTLAAHVDGVARHLTSRLLSGGGEALRTAIETTLAALDDLANAAGAARGAAREALIDRLTGLDAGLVAAAETELGPERVHALQAEAERELMPFKDRLDAAAWASALRVARLRGVRGAVGLPTVRFD